MMELHPIAKLFPSMPANEFERLVDDIRVNGLKLPILVHDGKILDGRHRAMACERLGIKPPIRTWNGKDAWLDAQSLNLIRRHLPQEQVAAIQSVAARQYPEVAAQMQAPKDEAKESRREHQGRPRKTADHMTGSKKPKTGESADDRGKQIGVSGATVKRLDRLARVAPEKVAEVAAGKSISKAMREVEQEKKANELKAAIAALTEEKKKSIASICEIRRCSCAELLSSGIKPDLVLTDPPYSEKYLSVFEELGMSCKEAHIPLIGIMVGQTYLPQIFSKLTQYLNYLWTFAYLTPGGQSVQIWKSKINTFWKPILIFGTKTEWSSDVLTSDANDNDKRFHHWGQSESGMIRLVEMLSKPGQLICDPFAGGGATAIAAISSSRRFIGCDVDSNAVKTANDRVALCLS